MIRGIPVILNKWSRETSLLKVDLSYVLVWVKFHDVPIVAYSSDGLNSIAYKIGNPMLLDSYTNEMCLESWGRSSYPRALIEINATNDLRDTLVVAVPKINETGYTKHTIRVEYEWGSSSM